MGLFYEPMARNTDWHVKVALATQQTGLFYDSLARNADWQLTAENWLLITDNWWLTVDGSNILLGIVGDCWKNFVYLRIDYVVDVAGAMWWGLNYWLSGLSTYRLDEYTNF